MTAVPLKLTVDFRVMVKLGTLRVVRLPFNTVTTSENVVAGLVEVVLLAQGSVSVIVTRVLEAWMVEVNRSVSVSIMVWVVEPLPMVVGVVVMVTKTVAVPKAQTDDEVAESASRREVAVSTPAEAREGVEMVAEGDMERISTPVVASTAADEEVEEGSEETAATDMTLSTESGVELGLP